MKGKGGGGEMQREKENLSRSEKRDEKNPKEGKMLLEGNKEK